MKHKHPEIDLLKLITVWNGNAWEEMIREAIEKNDLKKLSSTLYGIQRGMDRMAKNNLNSPKVCEIFAKLTRSIEYAAKQIFKKKYPTILDTKTIKPDHDHIKEFRNKKLRDELFRKFLQSSRY